MANTTIELRQSGSTGNTPSLGVLANGELAINRADGILYYKSSSNTLGSIRTTQPAGLTKEVQFNDAGSFGTDSDFTYDKTANRLNVENVVVNTAITIGSASGGTITGANLIYSNVFVANSTTTSTSNSTGAIISNGGLGVKGNVYADGVYDGGIEVITFANLAFTKANTANITADAAFVKANAANVIAQAAFDKANSVTQQGFVTVAANGTSVVADANNDTLTITAATANGIQILANATSDTIDFGLKPSGVTSGTYGNTSTAVTITIDQFGRITSVSQTAITAVETDPLALAYAIALG